MVSTIGDLPEAPAMRQQGMSGWRGVPAGLCRAWPLPADETCAGITRRLFREAVAQLGLEPCVLDDATLMASELAANTLRHTGGGGTFRIWHTRLEILCQVEDEGWITDPLAGRRRRPAAEPGHGLWLVNQVCDLVELRSGRAGTTIRLHFRLPAR